MGKNRLEVYLSPSEIQTLRERAHKERKSVSLYCADIIRQSLKNQIYEDVNKQIHLEERIGSLTQLAVDELKKILRANEDLLARAGVYAAAVWEMLKDAYRIPDVRRKEILSIASRRLREKFEEELGEKKLTSYLFSLPLTYIKHIYPGSIATPPIIKAFDEHNIPLTRNAKISIIDRKNWQLTDGSEKYRIENTGTQLNIYLIHEVEKIETIPPQKPQQQVKKKPTIEFGHV